MFERFTHEARVAVVQAQEVARAVGADRIDSQHVLVALLESGGPLTEPLEEAGVDAAQLAAQARIDVRGRVLDGDALAELGIDLEAVRRRVDEVFGEGALDRVRRTPRGHIPFTKDAKKVLEQALRVAIQLEHRVIDGRHLLLGLLRTDGPGRAFLVRERVDLRALRERLERRGDAA